MSEVVACVGKRVTRREAKGMKMHEGAVDEQTTLSKRRSDGEREKRRRAAQRPYE